MVKILSQDEIDSLINSVAGEDLSGGTFDEKPKPHDRHVLSYDFKHPNRVNKDQIRAIESLHGGFASQLGSSYSAYTRSVVDVDLIAVDQITYSEYIMSLSSPSCSYIYQMDPLAGAGIMNISTSVVFLIVDKIFGGRGKPIETERELTGIEKSIMNKVLDKTMVALEKAWEHICAIKFRISAYETNPQFLQIVAPGETVVTVTLQIKLAGSYGVMTICYPYLSLEEIISRLSIQHWADSSKKKKAGTDFEQNIRRINPINSDLSVQMIGTSITMREMLNVRVGDVICLENSVKDEFTVLIQQKPKFLGRVGYVGGKKAVNLTRVIEPVLMGEGGPK